MRLCTFVSLLALAASLGACVPHTELALEPAVLSVSWSQPVSTAELPAESTAQTPVVRQKVSASLADLLGSPELAQLTARALEANPDFRAAQARIDQAMGSLRIARGAALPLVTLSAGARASRDAASGPFEFSTSFAAIDAMLSIDLSGGQRAAKRAAADRVRATAFDRATLALALSADVARLFVQRATLNSRIGLLDRSITDTTKLKRILEIRQREGVATRVDVGLQIIRVRELEAERNRLDQARDQTRTALAVLVGEEAPRFASAPADLGSFYLGSISVPAPSMVIAGRPDVRAAEARIRAAGGDVAAARAAFFPRLDLSVSRAAQGMLSGGPLAGIVIGADLLLPIFSRNRLKGDLEVAAAAQREAVENYRAVLLRALADVEDSVSAVGHARERGSILTDIEREAAMTAGLAQQQYLEGDADLRAVFDAQDLLIRAQDAKTIGIQEQLEASIALYRATRRTDGLADLKRLAASR